MRRLEQMADMGLNIGRRLERQAEVAAAHAESEAVPDNLPHSRRLDEIARAFAQVGRAVAILTALEDRIDRGLPALPDLDRSRRLREQAAKDRRAAAVAGVEHALSLDPALASPRRLAGLKLNLDRLLDQEALDLDAFLDRPLPQLVERLRRRLGLDPIEDETALWAEERPPAGASAQTPPPSYPFPVEATGPTHLPFIRHSRAEGAKRPETREPSRTARDASPPAPHASG